MSVKHVKEYYEQVYQEYKQMVDELKDFEIEAQNGMFEPERLEQIKEDIRPLMDNYERWSYMIFLLNQPNKKEKIKKYQKQNEKLLSQYKKENSIESTLQENKQVIEKLKEQHK